MPAVSGAWGGGHSAETVWPAPAKLNLLLHITARRADGYHELQTIFQLLDLCDSVGISVRGDGLIERPEGPPGVTVEQDLAVRAARALRAAGGTRLGATLRLQKRIPMGGGLGGGSSDAATVLVALNRLWGLDLPHSRLAQIGLTLGADVPVFVHGSSAWASGRGEILEALELPRRWYVIIDPGVAVSTSDVFQAPELTRNSPIITIRDLFGGSGAAGQWRNDCEPVARHRYPEVGAALDWLSRLAPARLTGTGGCMFAEFARAEDAEVVAARVPSHWRSFVAQGLATSPLHAQLRREAARG